MSELKATPGPWTLCFDGGIDGPNGEFICSFQWGSFREFYDNPELKGTARLITASPQLYEALQASDALLVLFVSRLASTFPPDLIDKSLAVLEANKSALSLARGDQA